MELIPHSNRVIYYLKTVNATASEMIPAGLVLAEPNGLGLPWTLFALYSAFAMHLC